AALLAVVSARWAAASYNDGSRLAAVECLVDHHTLSIDDSVYVRPPRSGPGPHPYRADFEFVEDGTLDKVRVGGHYYSDKPPPAGRPRPVAPPADRLPGGVGVCHRAADRRPAPGRGRPGRGGAARGRRRRVGRRRGAAVAGAAPRAQLRRGRHLAARQLGAG